jgi:hypothetical protein
MEAYLNSLKQSTIWILEIELIMLNLDQNLVNLNPKSWKQTSIHINSPPFDEFQYEALPK